MDNKKIKDAIDKLNKNFGSGTVMSFDKDEIVPLERISTGSLQLDMITGGGWPKGRIIEIYGPESSGKSSISLHAIAEANKNGKVAALIDAEHAFDPVYAENLGVHVSDPNLFLISQPNNGDEAIEVARELVNTGEVSVIVIDSVAALVPKAELQGDVGDSKMGLQARLMSQSMRMLTGDINKTGTVVIFINQLRDKLGIMFGNPETTTGGNALKFYASIRCDVRRISINKDGDEAKSNRTKVKIVKNKTFPPFKQCEFDIVYGVGIDSCGEVLDLAVEYEIVKKSGSWYSYQEARLGQGKDAVISTLRDNPELVEELKEQVLKQLK